MPESMRKHLNPSAPACAIGSSSATLPGTTPPQSATSQEILSPRSAACFSRSARSVVVTGTELSGMSTMVVMPPAAAASVAVQ